MLLLQLKYNVYFLNIILFQFMFILFEVSKMFMVLVDYNNPADDKLVAYK